MALRCASIPRPDWPCFSVDTRGSPMNLPRAIGPKLRFVRYGDYTQVVEQNVVEQASTTQASTI